MLEVEAKQASRKPGVGSLVSVGLIVLGLATALGALGCWLLGLGSIVFQQNSGTFHRARWEAVVDRVRSLGVQPGESRAFRLDDLSDPQTLRVRGPGEQFSRGQGAGNVWAKRSAGGKLTVVIETRDLGHAGEYGFAYSEQPLAPIPFGGAWFSVDVPGHLTLVQPNMQIDGSWWKVLYNLD